MVSGHTSPRYDHPPHSDGDNWVFCQTLDILLENYGIRGKYCLKLVRLLRWWTFVDTEDQKMFVCFWIIWCNFPGPDEDAGYCSSQWTEDCRRLNCWPAKLFPTAASIKIVFLVLMDLLNVGFLPRRSQILSPTFEFSVLVQCCDAIF